MKFKDKVRITFFASKERKKEIEDIEYENRVRNQSTTIDQLLDKGIEHKEEIKWIKK